MSARVRPTDIPRDVLALCRELEQHGYKAWVVGGCLRDLLRGHPASDWDLATSARPEQVQKVFPRVFPTGVQHGTVTVRHRGQSYELTTLRGEGAYSDGRRPDSVSFVDDIEADLARRDFTVNAIAYDPLADRLIDPFDGLGDLDRGLIRAVGRPEARFSEDGLRVLRAARFAAALEFELDAQTEAAIRPTLGTFRKVSAERVREEWLKSLKAREPSRAFAVMARTGILEVTLPGLAALDGATKQWAFRALDASPAEPCLRLAALLSPLASERAQLDAWLVQYKFSNLERERVLRMLEHLEPEGADAWSDAEVRRFAQCVGREWLDEVTLLGTLVAQARFGLESPQAAAAGRLHARARAQLEARVPLVTKDLAVSGKDLIGALRLTPGPLVGRVLEGLLARVIEEPALNQREKLLELARGIAEGG